MTPPRMRGSPESPRPGAGKRVGEENGVLRCTLGDVVPWARPAVVGMESVATRVSPIPPHPPRPEVGPVSQRAARRRRKLRAEGRRMRVEVPASSGQAGAVPARSGPTRHAAGPGRADGPQVAGGGTGLPVLAELGRAGRTPGPPGVGGGQAGAAPGGRGPA